MTFLKMTFGKKDKRMNERAPTLEEALFKSLAPDDSDSLAERFRKQALEDKENLSKKTLEVFDVTNVPAPIETAKSPMFEAITAANQEIQKNTPLAETPPEPKKSNLERIKELLSDGAPRSRRNIAECLGKNYGTIVTIFDQHRDEFTKAGKEGREELFRLRRASGRPKSAGATSKKASTKKSNSTQTETPKLTDHEAFLAVVQKIISLEQELKPLYAERDRLYAKIKKG